MSPDLRRELERVAEASAVGGNQPPPLGALWRTGRRRRRRRQALAVGTAMVLAAALVGGAMALIDDGSRQQVTAGPTTSLALEPTVDGPAPLAPPPEESGLVQVKMTIGGSTGETVKGRPRVESGGAFDVSYDIADEWVRGLGADWERWTGTAWETTHRLGQGRGLDLVPSVVPVSEGVGRTPDGNLGSGPGPFPGPDRDPGLVSRVHGTPRLRCGANKALRGGACR